MDDQNQTLKLNQALEAQSEYLVQVAGEAVSDGMMKKLRDERGRLALKVGQFNNLLGVALETDSPRVVQNWLLYQMGRSDRNTRPWKESGLGQKVVDAIQNFEQPGSDLHALAENAARLVWEKPQAADVQRVHIQLTRRYIGYLRRWFVARGGQEGGEE
jgi:hypothetical protein